MIPIASKSRKPLKYKENPVVSMTTGFLFLWSRVRESNPWRKPQTRCKISKNYLRSDFCSEFL
nr:MAG TPA: hypothetical protein [Caudoviricetes sp.]